MLPSNVVSGWDVEVEALYRGEYTTLKRRADILGGTVIDGDDLLSEALENFIRQRLRGWGPQGSITAYLTRSMRNRVIDETRSPRSRTRLFYDDEDLPHESRSNFHVDCAEETCWIREALTRVPQPQRELLLETVVHGRAPADLIRDQDRSPNAIYCAIRRAKHRLRRELLLVVLEEVARPDCAAAIGRMPDVIAPDLDDMDPTSPAIEHLRSCSRCHRRWLRYRQIPEALS